MFLLKKKLALGKDANYSELRKGAFMFGYFVILRIAFEFTSKLAEQSN